MISLSVWMHSCLFHSVDHHPIFLLFNQMLELFQFGASRLFSIIFLIAFHVLQPFLSNDLFSDTAQYSRLVSCCT